MNDIQPQSAPRKTWRQLIADLLASEKHLHPSWLLKIFAAPLRIPSGLRKVAALSGGKDSTAMCLAQAYFEPAAYEYIITPTGDELPDMIAHWALCEEMLGAPLTPVGIRTLQGLIVEQRMLPNHRARWCTRMIKLEPYYGWLATIGPVISYVGLRADEEGRPGMVFPSVGSIEIDFPMQRWGWTIEDVLAFLDFLGVIIPDRSDCALCFWQKLGEWYNLWLHYPERYQRGIEIEAFVTASRGASYTFRSPQRDSWPASLADLGAEFEKGRVPTASLAIMDKRRLVGACRVCTL